MAKTSEDTLRTMRNTKIMCGTSLPGTTVKTDYKPQRKRDGLLKATQESQRSFEDKVMRLYCLPHYITTVFTKTYKCSK